MSPAPAVELTILRQRLIILLKRSCAAGAPSAIRALDTDHVNGTVDICGNPALPKPLGIPCPPIASFRIMSGRPEALEGALDGGHGVLARSKSIADLGGRG